MSPPDSKTLGQLLQHDPWLRRLAVALVGPSDADDLVQETWMAAAKRPPAGAPRPWLAAVARRLARQSARRRSRTARRERAAARPEVLPSTEETLSALAVQREVTAAVDALAEPYRTAVLLRYHHELAYGELAARMACSPAAARQRVSRGLERIRVALAERHGADWRAMPGVALLCASPAHLAAAGATGTTAASGSAKAAVPLILGALAMPKLLSGAAAVILCVLIGMWAIDGSDPVAESVAAAPSQAQPEAGSKAGTRNAPAVLDRDEVPAESTPGPVAGDAGEDQPDGPHRVRGRVVDLEGQPVAGVPIVIREGGVGMPAGALEPGGAVPSAGTGEAPELPAGELLTYSIADGSFSAAVEGYVQLGVAAPWCSLTTRELRPELANDEVLLVVAPAVRVSGVVLGAPPGGGAPEPLAGARVEPIKEKLVSLPFALDRAERMHWPAVRTDAEGRFRFPVLPSAGHSLRFSMPGYQGRTIGLPADDADDLRIALEPVGRPWVDFQGTVFLPGGGKAEGGTVGFDETTAAVGADGTYRLRLKRRDLLLPGTFFAAAPGYQCAIIKDPVAEGAPMPDGSTLLDITLPAEEMVISGTVLDPSGEPWPGVLVYPWMEPTLGWQKLLEDHSQHEREGRAWMLGSSRTFAITDADGHFTLRGLRDKVYDLRFLHEESRANMTLKQVDAGSEGFVVRFAPNALLPEQSGIVVDPTGKPIAGAAVYCSVVTWASSNGGSQSVHDESTTTDERGRFTLQDVPSHGAVLVAEHPDHLRAETPPTVGGGLRLVLPRRCHIRLDVSRSYPAAVRWRVLDAAGEALDLFQVQMGSSSWSRSRTLEGGRSEVMQVSEYGVSVELQDGDGKVLATLPLRLQPGEVTEVR